MSMNADNVDDGNMYLNFSYKRKHYFWELFYFIPFYSLKGVQIDITSSFFISSFYFLLQTRLLYDKQRYVRRTYIIFKYLYL